MGKIMLLLFVWAARTGFAQQHTTGTLTGRIVAIESGTGLGEAQLLLPRLKQLFSTDTNGTFSIPGLPYGVYTIHLRQVTTVAVKR